MNNRTARQHEPQPLQLRALAVLPGLARRAVFRYRPLRPGDYGVDYSGARPTPQQLIAQGSRFFKRYSAGVRNHDPDYQWKLCTKAEFDAGIKAGEDFFAVSELYETRIEEGYAAGKADGAADLIFWQNIGLAKGAGINCCWDTYPNPAKYDAVEAYLRGYGESLQGYYKRGLYAGDKAIREMKKRGVIDYGFMPNAISWSDYILPYAPSNPRAYLDEALAKSAAEVWQTGNYLPPGTKNEDQDMILRVPCGSHLQALNGGDDMPLTNDEIDRIAARVWSYGYHVPGRIERRMDYIVGHAWDEATKAHFEIGQVKSAVAGVTKLLSDAKSGALIRLAHLQTQVANLNKKVAALKPGDAIDVTGLTSAVVTKIKALTFKAED